MFKIIEANGERIELTTNSAIKLVYKQVFKRELDEDMANINFKKLKQIAKKAKEKIGDEERQEEQDIEGALEDNKEMNLLIEFVIRLGFIMVTLGRPFHEYWGKTEYSQYVEWRTKQNLKTLQAPEFILGVMSLYREENKPTSTSKN